MEAKDIQTPASNVELLRLKNKERKKKGGGGGIGTVFLLWVMNLFGVSQNNAPNYSLEKLGFFYGLKWILN